MFFEGEEKYERNKKTLFSLVWENVSEETQDLIMTRVGYEQANTHKNPKWLLKNLHSIVEDFDDKKHIILSLDDQLERMVKIRQGNMAVKDYIRTFRQEYKTLHEHGGTFLDGETLQDLIEKRLSEAEEDGLVLGDQDKEQWKTKITKELDEEVETFALLKRADKKRFGNLQIKLKNAYLLGRNEYPKTVQELTKILKNYEQEWPVQGERLQRQRNNGTTLLQEGQAGNDFEFLKGTTGTFFAHITCTACNKKGHYKSHCPAVDSEGNHLGGASAGTLRDAPVIEEALAAARRANRRNRNGNDSQGAGGDGGTGARSSVVSSDGNFPFCFTSNTDSMDPNWLLLDSESNVNLFRNPDLVTDISKVTNGEGLVLSSNGGTQDSDKQAKFGDMTVWFNPNSLANILSPSIVAEHFRVTMDTFVDNSFMVHLNDNVKLKFRCHENGLYYCDTKDILKDDLHIAFSFFQNALKKSTYVQAKVSCKQ